MYVLLIASFAILVTYLETPSQSWSWRVSGGLHHTVNPQLTACQAISLLCWASAAWSTNGKMQSQKNLAWVSLSFSHIIHYSLLIHCLGDLRACVGKSLLALILQAGTKCQHRTSIEPVKAKICPEICRIMAKKKGLMMAAKKGVDFPARTCFARMCAQVPARHRSARIPSLY